MRQYVAHGSMDPPRSPDRVDYRRFRNAPIDSTDFHHVRRSIITIMNVGYGGTTKRSELEGARYSEVLSSGPSEKFQPDACVSVLYRLKVAVSDFRYLIRQLGQHCSGVVTFFVMT